MAEPASISDQSLTLRAQAEQIAALVTPLPGRPPLERDPDTIQLLLAALADGNYRQTACRVAGISPQTLHNATKRAEAGETAAMALMEAIEKAEATAEAETVRNVRVASKLPQFWAAGMTLLERKSPDRWGRRQDDASVPRVVVQIGARDSDVSVSVGHIITHSHEPSESTHVIPTSYTESAQVTEGGLSDAESGRIKVTTDERATQASVPPVTRRGNRVGLQPGRRGPATPDGAGKRKEHA